MFSKRKIPSLSSVVGSVIQIQHLQVLQIVDMVYETFWEIQQWSDFILSVIAFLHIVSASFDLFTGLTI